MTTTRDSFEFVPGNTIALLEADEYQDVRRCPLCGHEVSDVGTPAVPTDLLVLRVSLEERDSVPVFGAVCDRHRDSVQLLAPAEVAPENYVSVDATVDGQAVEIALPEPVYQDLFGGEDNV